MLEGRPERGRLWFSVTKTTAPRLDVNGGEDGVGIALLPIGRLVLVPQRVLQKLSLAPRDEKLPRLLHPTLNLSGRLKEF